MARHCKVLGIDLACAGWESVGTALLTFEGAGVRRWGEARLDVIDWPGGPVTAARLASAVTAFAAAEGVRAIGLDGPHGWRDPGARDRPGVGRRCDLEARAPGKVGPYGITYPGTWRRWITLSIDVFSELLARPGMVLANDPAAGERPENPGSGCLVLETFPTSTWRSSGLDPLPGHRKAPPPVVRRFAISLARRYGLPDTAVTDHHDHLQALVAALPAAGLRGGPCQAVARGEPARIRERRGKLPEHRVEGLIWEARPPG